MDFNSRNVLSDGAHERELLKPFVSEDFQIDLQLFGHSSGGKGVGKILLSIGLAAFGWFNPAVFGLSATAHFGAAVMGAAIASTVWTAFNKPKMDMGSMGSPDVQRFDRAQETMSSDGLIPVVYGYRKVTGNQTFHQTNSEANQLHKHVVLCEGGIDGIESVCANDLLIPTEGQQSGAVFTIQNRKHTDAAVSLANKTLALSANGVNHSVYLCNKDDASSSGSFYEWQMNISSLIAYINRMGDGWEAFPTATTTKYPGDLKLPKAGNCYNNPLKLTADTVKGGTKYTFHDCEAPDNYNEVGGYPQLAWLDMHFNTSAELNGNPNVSAIVRGKKVYDIRTGKTVYSTNPALCLRDFMLSKRYGLGKWVTAEDLDEDSWREAADYCDEVIEFHNADNVVVRAKRYELNMIIDQSNSAINWLQEILANFCGYLTITHGKFKLKIEKKEPVSYRFTDNNCSDLSVAPLKLSETPNKYSVKIIDPRNNWQSVSCLCEDFSDQKERGKVVTKEVQLNGVTSQNQALRLARFYRDYNLACPLQISFTTGYQAMHLEPGDVVTVSYHDVFKDLPIRIAEIRETEEHKYTISGRQYNPDLYNDDLGGGVSWYNYIPVNENTSTERRRPGQVSGLSARTRYRTRMDGSTAYDIVVNFKLPQRYDVNTAVVSYRTNNAIASDVQEIPTGVALDKLGFLSPWKSAGESQGTLVIPNVHIGDEYEFRVQAKSDEGLLSSESNAPHCVCVVTPKSTVPACPQNLHFDFSEKFLFIWDDVADSDVMYYEVRKNTKVGDNDGLLGRTTDRSLAVSLTSRSGKVYVYAINAYKKASYPAIVTYKYPAPKAPTEITVNKIPRGVSIVAPPLPYGATGANFYVTGTSYSKVFRQNNPVVNLMEKPGIYDVKVCYVDRMGEGEMSQIFSAVIEPTFPEEWIKDGSLSIEKFDGIAKAAVADLKDTAKKMGEFDTSLAEIQKSNSEIIGKVQDIQTNTASQITQMSNEIDFKIADNRKGLASDVKLNTDKIQQIITDLNTDPSKSGYSAITQLVDGINARVQKGDVINQINMTSNGTVIDGKYLHVTGKTKFDDDIITESMIKAGSITADKLAAGAISADQVNVKELSALSAKIGLLRTKDNGARVEISDNLIKVYDENNVLRVKLGVW